MTMTTVPVMEADTKEMNIGATARSLIAECVRSGINVATLAQAFLAVPRPMTAGRSISRGGGVSEKTCRL